MYCIKYLHCSWLLVKSTALLPDLAS